ncbi:MAG: Ribosome-binding factor [Schlesneria sp.]|nr:Ribosome-binding factor [Schlesneria sp.]
MNSRRMAKASEAIRETASTVVLFELRDPRVKNITVLSVEVSPDLRNAKIYVTIMGDAKAQSLAMHGLESARGFIQSKIADRLQTKNAPIIRFVLDPSVKKSIEVSQALQAANLQDSQASSDASEEEDLDEDDEETDHETDGISEDDSANDEK